MTDTTAAEYHAEAARHFADATESFDRCDTDGFVTQFCSELGGRKALRNATIAENGGLALFPALFDLDGNWVPARLIENNFGGTSWMILDADGKRTGQYVNAFPVRRATIVKKGFLEGEAWWPATADYHGKGRGFSGLASVRVVTRKTCRDDVPPTRIECTDRWAED